MTTATATISNEFRSVIMSAIFLKGVDVEPEDVGAMSAIFEKDVKKRYPHLSPQEIRLAVEKGVHGDYGEYYGINNVTLLKWIKAYATSEERFNHHRKSQKLLMEKNPPSQHDKINIIKQGIIRKFNEYKETGLLADYGNPSYNYLAKAGVINIAEDKRAEYRRRAQNKLIAENTIKLTTHTHQRQDILKVLEDLRNNTMDAQVTAEAKRMALKDFFQDIISQGKDISEFLK